MVTSTPISDSNNLIMPSGHDLDENDHAFLHSAARMPISGVKVTDLGTNFCPSRFDVLCSRGKASWNHEGNVFFRKLVQLNAHRYDSSRCRLERSIVVSELVDCIRSRATGFVKKEQKSGMWIEVGDELAREKVGQMMRNLLGGFRSSLKSKTAKRKLTVVKLAKRTHEIMVSSSSIRTKVEEIEQDCNNSNVGVLTDREALDMLTQQNLSLLSILKDDKELQKKFVQAETAVYDEQGSSSDNDDESSM
eukprot:Nitzschia sp. Nitz4//scaffold143_size57137//1905//2651//NITZ4_006504-RA/size57137-processed-gene-0.31-mRNA-1//1//CDS//3329536416//852//frame0